MPSRAGDTAARGECRPLCHATYRHAPDSSATEPATVVMVHRIPIVAGHAMPAHAPAMFVVTEEDEAAISAVYEQRGEFAAAIELRRLFPGITDNAQARECVRAPALAGSRYRCGQ